VPRFKSNCQIFRYQGLALVRALDLRLRLDVGTLRQSVLCEMVDESDPTLHHGLDLALFRLDVEPGHLDGRAAVH